jgi:hypothetical protein
VTAAPMSATTRDLAERAAQLVELIDRAASRVGPDADAREVTPLVARWIEGADEADALLRVALLLVRRLGRQRIAVLPLTRDELLRLPTLAQAAALVLTLDDCEERTTTTGRIEGHGT